jgi:hypothetical protein
MKCQTFDYVKIMCYVSMTINARCICITSYRPKAFSVCLAPTSSANAHKCWRHDDIDSKLGTA